MSTREPCEECGAVTPCAHYPAYVDGFADRVRLAATCIRTGDGLSSRAFDNCFEMDDSAAVVASLDHLAQTDAALRTGIQKMLGSPAAQAMWDNSVQKLAHIPFAKLSAAARQMRDAASNRQFKLAV